MSKLLRDLVTLLPDAQYSGNLKINIDNIDLNSNDIKTNSIFVCIPGQKTDGHDFILDVVQKGAVALLVEKKVNIKNIAVIQVKNTRAAMRILAPEIYDYPSKRLKLIGITGTNGKTTITYLLKAIFEQAGYKCGLIGTIQSLINNEIISVKNTTPDNAQLQYILAKMLSNKIEYVFMEVSSHAIALGRIYGCEFKAALFSNLTQDHLDFHKTMEEYRQTKTQLFLSLKDKSYAVFNADELSTKYMSDLVTVKKLFYGINCKANYTANSISIKDKGCGFILKINNNVNIKINSRLTGLFNIYNILAAITIAQEEGICIKIIKKALKYFLGVTGRFDFVDIGQDFFIIIDYAHSPDSLENLLKTVRELAQGNILTIFGCGGERDKSKRPLMGAVAAKYSDFIIITNDNPRCEDANKIANEIELGIIKQNKGIKQNYIKLQDRKKAIYKSLEMAKKNDFVVLAGKGHETYQLLPEGRIYFNEKEIVCEALENLGKNGNGFVRKNR